MKFLLTFLLFAFITFEASNAIKCYKCKGFQCNRSPDDIATVDCGDRYCWVGKILGLSNMGCGYKRCSLSFLSLGSLLSSKCCQTDYCNGPGKPSRKKKPTKPSKPDYYDYDENDEDINY
ncbi:hypothetical protein SNEBB_007018 [Seison nebaliae]|nr:hypothetical protein SNEBB_007018 [Seison nebaliae]